MADLTREQIENFLIAARAYGAVFGSELAAVMLDVEQIASICTMALRAIDAEESVRVMSEEHRGVDRALLAAGISPGSIYTFGEQIAELAEDRDHYKAEVEHLRASDAGWRPMETAPKSGYFIVCDASGSVGEGFWDGSWCWVYEAQRTIKQPLAWMPLPPPFTGDPKALEPEPVKAEREAGKCKGCSGYGWVQGTRPHSVTCLDCNGTGKIGGG